MSQKSGAVPGGTVTTKLEEVLQTLEALGSVQLRSAGVVLQSIFVTTGQKYSTK